MRSSHRLTLAALSAAFLLAAGCDRRPAATAGTPPFETPPFETPPFETPLFETPRFEAVAGLPDAPMFSFGPAWGYLDGDDRPDLYVPHHYGHRALGLRDLLLVDDGAGGFRDVGPALLRLGTRFPRDEHAAVWAGFRSRDPNALDLYQSVGGREGDASKRSEIEYLFLVNEGGHLVNRAVEAGVQALLARGPLLRGRTALPLDFDRDGGTDLLLLGAGSPLRLLRWNGGGFDDATAAGFEGIRPRGEDGWRGTIADLDGDGYEDVVLPNGAGRGLAVFANEKGHFVRRPELSGGLGRVAAVFPMAGGDDPFVDLAVLPVRTGDATPIRIAVNEGAWHFRLVDVPTGPLAGRGMQLNGADVDNDGDTDLLAVTRQRLYLLENLGGTFRDVTAETGLDAVFNQDQPGELVGVAVADYDLDGRLDLAAVRGRGGPGNDEAEPGRLLLARNVGRAGRLLDANWLRARLVGRDPGALGTLVTVTDARGHKRYYPVTNGVAGTCQNDPALHLGLGDADAVDLDVRWPSGTSSRRSGVRAGELLRLDEPPARPQPE